MFLPQAFSNVFKELSAICGPSALKWFLVVLSGHNCKTMGPGGRGAVHTNGTLLPTMPSNIAC